MLAHLQDADVFVSSSPLPGEVLDCQLNIIATALYDVDNWNVLNNKALRTMLLLGVFPNFSLFQKV